MLPFKIYINISTKKTKFVRENEQKILHKFLRFTYRVIHAVILSQGFHKHFPEDQCYPLHSIVHSITPAARPYGLAITSDGCKRLAALCVLKCLN